MTSLIDQLERLLLDGTEFASTFESALKAVRAGMELRDEAMKSVEYDDWPELQEFCDKFADAVHPDD